MEIALFKISTHINGASETALKQEKIWKFTTQTTEAWDITRKTEE